MLLCSPNPGNFKYVIRLLLAVPRASLRSILYRANLKKTKSGIQKYQLSNVKIGDNFLSF